MYVFIDDQRDPPFTIYGGPNQTPVVWTVIRSYQEFYLRFRLEPYLPSFISFDHDLGDEEKTGHDIAKLIVTWDMGDNLAYPKIPDDFTWEVHSQNPVGRDNINGLLQSYLDFRKEYGKHAANVHDGGSAGER